MTTEIQRAVQLGKVMVEAQQRVDKLTAELQQAKDLLRTVAEEDLPELMRELGLKMFRLEDGSVIEVKEEVDCAITDERRPAAHAWLVAHGFGGLIKTEVVTQFERGEGEAAQRFAEEVELNTGHHPVVQERVHPATLKSFIKERMAAGDALPNELFGIRPYNKAKISRRGT